MTSRRRLLCGLGVGAVAGLAGCVSADTLSSDGSDGGNGSGDSGTVAAEGAYPTSLVADGRLVRIENESGRIIGQSATVRIVVDEDTQLGVGQLSDWFRRDDTLYLYRTEESSAATIQTAREEPSAATVDDAVVFDERPLTAVLDDGRELRLPIAEAGTAATS
ncbi:hypothetical protein BRD17_02805 [Halobacteriales archaeon SW_7_68_16]|nr:MAG: hypothetical protein BRD17_02805 [Halobacteriales archaeon SW_7_68_16]